MKKKKKCKIKKLWKTVVCSGIIFYPPASSSKTFSFSAVSGFDCRCGNLFCGIHRYSDKHNCPYDYKAEAAAKIRKENPVVVAEKIQRIWKLGVWLWSLEVIAFQTMDSSPTFPPKGLVCLVFFFFSLLLHIRVFWGPLCMDVHVFSFLFVCELNTLTGFYWTKEMLGLKWGGFVSQ